jgi:hypothetical protein
MSTLTLTKTLNGEFVVLSDLKNLPANVEFYAAAQKDGQSIKRGYYLGNGNTNFDFI